MPHFTQNITESLDEVAPLKTFTVRSHHKFGISEETKKLMVKRDNCRSQMNESQLKPKKSYRQNTKCFATR